SPRDSGRKRSHLHSRWPVRSGRITRRCKMTAPQAQHELTIELKGERYRITDEFLSVYNRPGPRYTSYPTAPVWQDNIGPDDMEQFFAQAEAAKTPVSLYMHLPFCESLCLFCACNVVITKDHGVTPPYLTTLKREIDHFARFVSGVRQVAQFHWG